MVLSSDIYRIRRFREFSPISLTISYDSCYTEKMLLKRLEISGFKSFAKPATLEFPVPVTAIVGPNGSGKSNVADSLRWVLGEQSMKSLRGKKGEDLIFGGTPSVPRLGKAMVSLVFDNTNKIFPYEFDEVVISRRVYRDGVNEYLLNNSPARLKDVIELLSKIGLGASQHQIIGQGDADRVLYASPKERKSMIEDALGLRIFEIKKIEAERKLLATEENMKNIESLRREIKPHLKYLEEQAKKSQNVAVLRDELSVLTSEYISCERMMIESVKKELSARRHPLETAVKDLSHAATSSEALLKKEQNANSFFADLKKFDEAEASIREKRRAIEREITKSEIEAAHQSVTPQGAMPIEKVRAIFHGLREDLERAQQASSMELLKKIIFSVTQTVYRTLEEISPNNDIPQKVVAPEVLARLRASLHEIEGEEAKITQAKKELENRYREDTKAAEQAALSYRHVMDELSRTEGSLRELAFEEERLKAREHEFHLDFGEFMKAEHVVESPGNILEMPERDSLRKKIERLRIRIEEAGGVDESVIKEFEATRERDQFLERELADLTQAKQQVADMIQELSAKIAEDFASGIKKINALFGHFFHDIFGGGKAELKLFIPKKKIPVPPGEDGEEEWEEAEDKEPGLDIIVDIPRKRIKSLAMLSGGERALTSIALLFAVSTVNPPPFLVLDETDAALDEANSQRYAGMLGGLADKAQLIVITHNRSTMKAASILYGVTMGADGVSKLLSIKLEEAEDVIQKKK
jgi:chromosome segregation protein